MEQQGFSLIEVLAALVLVNFLIFFLLQLPLQNQFLLNQLILREGGILILDNASELLLANPTITPDVPKPYSMSRIQHHSVISLELEWYKRSQSITRTLEYLDR